ncbi:MAG: hypothetical protein WCO06_07275 [Candidatus Roizmanbacteria bacterium]
MMFLCILNSSSWGISLDIPILQDGISMHDFEKTANIIAKNSSGPFNVTMDSQQDNRAYPIRFFLHVLKKEPEPYTNYSSIPTLFILIRTNKSLSQLNTWEYKAFGMLKQSKSWKISNTYSLYKVTK